MHCSAVQYSVQMQVDAGVRWEVDAGWRELHMSSSICGGRKEGKKGRWKRDGRLLDRDRAAFVGMGWDGEVKSPDG